MSYRQVTDNFYVVETEDDEIFLGRVCIEEGQVTVYNGFTGRPPVITKDRLRRMILAESHPDVVST